MRDWSLVRRLRGSFRSRAFERELAAELDAHLAYETEALIAAGLSPTEARNEARRRFGSTAEVEDACRDAWGLRGIESVLQDVRFALRTLWRHPIHALMSMLTLGVGIGAATAIFSALNAVLLRPLPYRHGDALVEIRQQAVQSGINDLNLSAIELADYRRRTGSFDAIVEYHQMGFNLVDAAHGPASSHVVTGVVSAQFFDVVGIEPILGRAFRAEDDAPGAEAVLILSYPFWQRMFSGDPAVIGRGVELNDRVHTVVGVLPDVPLYPNDNDVFMPVSACPFRSAPEMATDRAMRMVSAVARLKPGVSTASADREVAAIGAAMSSAFPQAYESAAGFVARVEAVRDLMTARARPTVLALLAATIAMLGLVCANVSNMILARLLARRRELALRVALGAGRSRITRQLLTESTTLAAGGGALGIVLALLARRALVAFVTPFTTLAAGISIDRTVLGFSVGLVAASAVMVGLVPALRLQSPERYAGPKSSARRVLIAAQVTIAFVLLTASVLLMRSFLNLRRADGGFRPDHVLTIRVDLDWINYDSPGKRRRYFRSLLSTLEKQPGVVHAALGLTFPLNQSSPFNGEFALDSEQPPDAHLQADFRMATPAYFDVLGMRMVRGRAFSVDDRAGSAAVAIVNEVLARHRFRGVDVVGRRLSFDEGRHWSTIIGVVNDVRQYGLDAAPVDEIYVPFDQQGPLSASVLVRSAGDPRSLQQTIERVARGIDSRQPLSRPQTLQAVRDGSLRSHRVTATLVAMLAVLALAITAAGIGSVAACGVRERAAEIGVRIALGARTVDVSRAIAADILKPVIAGIGCGLGLSAIAMPQLAKFLFGISASDGVAHALAAAAIIIGAGLACAPMARRAACIDPMQVLRTE
jgi:predicted permease